VCYPDCHCRKKYALGAGCADPSNNNSVSLTGTGRASIPSSILLGLDVLGAQAHSTHTVTVDVNSKLISLILNKHSSDDIMCIIDILDIIQNNTFNRVLI
jgi:hypothetical protein